MAPRLTISMAAYNEEACVAQVVREALETLDELDGDGKVIVVDDGSTDRTPEIVAEPAAADPRVRVVTHERNRGISGFNRSMVVHARGDFGGSYDHRYGEQRGPGRQAPPSDG